ncbi:uncharacterized protein LOC144753840 [Lissotriton helveticus]
MKALMDLIKAKGVAWASERLCANGPGDSGVVLSPPAAEPEITEDIGTTRSKRLKRPTCKDFPAEPAPAKCRNTEPDRNVIVHAAASPTPVVRAPPRVAAVAPPTNFATHDELVGPFPCGLPASEKGDDPLPTGTLAHLGVEQELRAMGERALAPGTRKRYGRHLANFNEAVIGMGLAGIPLEDRVQAFTVWAKKQGKSHSWICSHLAAVSNDAKLKGLRDPAQSFAIRAALKGWARDEPRTPDIRAPIDFRTLQSMLVALQAVAHSHFESSLFAAAFCLAFFGAFRSSELVARSKSDISGDALGRDDVSVDTNLTIMLRKSKTDQARKGVVIVLAPLEDQIGCPVSAVRAYLALRRTVAGYLLMHEDLSPLTRYQMDKIMMACLSRAGFSNKGKKFSSHSFRIGVATAASCAGMPAASIQKVGHWDSLCYKCYIRP